MRIKKFWRKPRYVAETTIPLTEEQLKTIVWLSFLLERDGKGVIHLLLDDMREELIAKGLWYRFKRRRATTPSDSPSEGEAP